MCDRQQRLQGVCDCINCGDPCLNWVTLGLKLIIEVMAHHGLCRKLGVPFTQHRRAANGVSFGHTEHGDLMTCGFMTPFPLSFVDYDRLLSHIDVETWVFNLMRSNFHEDYCLDWIEQVRTAVRGRPGLVVDVFKVLQPYEATRKFKDNLRWREVIAVKLNVAVEDLDNLTSLKAKVQIHPISKKTKTYVNAPVIAVAGPSAAPGPGPSTTSSRRRSAAAAETSAPADVPFVEPVSKRAKIEDKTTRDSSRQGSAVNPFSLDSD